MPDVRLAAAVRGRHHDPKGTANMRIRLVAGLVLSAVGVLWIAQGAGVAKGSMMTGHPAYSGLGAVVLIVGLFLLFSAWRGRRAGRKE